MRLPLHDRLNCPASFATDDSMHLHCWYGGACDGELHECCVWENEDLAIRAQMIADEEKIYMIDDADDDSEGGLIAED